MLTNQEQPPSFLLGTQEHPVQQLKASTKIITVCKTMKWWDRQGHHEERPQLLPLKTRMSSLRQWPLQMVQVYSLDRKPFSFQATISLVALTKRSFMLSKMLVATSAKGQQPTILLTLKAKLPSLNVADLPLLTNKNTPKPLVLPAWSLSTPMAQQHRWLLLR